MDFHTYRTSYGYYRDGGGRKVDELMWYDKTMTMLKGMKIPRVGNGLATLQAEQTWTAFGRPYYKVFPLMARAMSEVSIDIPGEQLRLPYPSFAIMLTNSVKNDMQEEGGLRVKSILVSEVAVRPESDAEFSIGSGVNLATGASRALHLNYQLDGMWNGEPADFDYTLSLYNKTETIGEFFERSFNMSVEKVDAEKGEYVPSLEMCRRIVSLAIATCFFGIDQHEVVMPDLPRKKIERKARQQGKGFYDALRGLKREMNQTKMWTIGREIELPPAEITYKKRSDSPEQREVAHAFMRRGHMRWQKVGEGRNDRKLVFVHPHICRPDLPWGHDRGYRITDQQTGDKQ